MKIARLGFMATGLCAVSSHVPASGIAIQTHARAGKPRQIEQPGLAILPPAGAAPGPRDWI
jgi:hypothetical protein